MDEKVKQQIVQLVQAASQGDLKATQMIQLIMTKAQQGDQLAIQIAQAIQQVMQEMLGQAQKAARGAKLNYLKKLSHKCADDEELVYYKKGGVVDCGCKKKMKDGGETPEKKNSVDEFKNRKIKKGCGGSKMSKVKSAGAGCSIADFKKKFKLGGSLNGIPFMQKGTPKEGIKWNKRTEPITYGGVQEGERTWYTYPSFINNKDSIVVQRDIRPRQFLTNVGYRRDPSNLDTTYYFSAPKEPTIFSQDDPRVKILFERIHKKYK